MESETEASIDTQPEASIDKNSDAAIDEELEISIDSDHANEIDDLPEGSINSWENDYYNLASRFRLLHLQRGKSAQWSQMNMMRTTEKKTSLSTLALPWKKHEFSGFPKRPDGKHRSTETPRHRSILITKQS